MKSVALMGTGIRYSEKSVVITLKGKYVNWFLVTHKVTETWTFKPKTAWKRKDYVKAAMLQSRICKITNWREQFYINAY